MRPTTLTIALKAVIPTGQAAYLWGPPGCGKSSIVRQVAEQLGRKCIDLRAVLLDPVDLRGLPTIGADGRAKWAPPEFLPLEGTPLGDEDGVIFVDELAQAAPLVQAAFLQAILDHQIGEARISRRWSWIAASNRQEDRAGGHRIISPLLNRFLHLDLEVHNDDWQNWAIKANVCPEVRAYVNRRPANLHKFDASAGERAFPTPRSWEFVSRILPATDDETIFELVKGCVGEGPAAEFIAFVKVYRSLPDADVVLKSPKSAPVPTEPDVLYAVCTAIVEKFRGDKQKLDPALSTQIGSPTNTRRCSSAIYAAPTSSCFRARPASGF